MEIEYSEIMSPSHERRILIPTAKVIRGIEIAKAASDHSDGLGGGRKLGAALFAGSRLVSIGFNSYSKSKPTNVFNEHGKTYCKSIHAEQSALLKYKRHYTNNNGSSKLTLYVVRYTSNGFKGCSKPCSMCQKFMKDFGIDEVVYFDLDGFVTLSKINNRN